ncbi:MAG: sodium-dependent transporter [Clostridia bacterium]|nr:sodium-dependent transporter [Clostridia bacterium]
MSEKRSGFSSRIGFVLAAAGSAVGLGNLWRFPYLAARYGGGIFLLVYLVLALTLGFTLMLAEIAIGRKTGLSAIGAFRSLNKKYTFIGYLASIPPVIILPYYCVIGGWVTKYLFVYLTGQGGAATQPSYFDNFVVQPLQPVLWFALFLGVTALVVLLGVEKGIEKVSKWMMPVLVVLSLFMAVYVLFLPGALDGVVYYLKPDFSHFSAKTVLAAMGQLFYSMSLAMGIMVTYGSYMKKEDDLTGAVHQIEIFDTGIAFLSGLMIVPAVFAFSGGDPEALGQGTSLMFKTLPQVFHHMPGGHIIGGVFFLLVLLAALTSSISLMETVVSILQDRLKWSRRVTCLAVLGLSVLLGVPSSLGKGAWNHIRLLGNDFFDFFDFAANSVVMPVVAILICLFVGYVLKPKTIIEEARLSRRNATLFTVIIRYVAPVCILLILITSVLDELGLFSF